MITNLAAYHFVPISDADALVDILRERCRQRELKGSILVAPEGINIFLAGAADAIHAWVEQLRQDARFAAIQVKLSHSQRVPFKRLLVKKKPEIIRFRQPGIDPVQSRAPALAPVTLARWLAAGHDDEGRQLRLLDTRNQQEVAYGSFDGAVTLPISSFSQLPAALADYQDQLADKTIISFCTGGVRCEKAALWLQRAGYQNVWQLDGGILGYFEQVGGYGYHQRCFVFDERIAVDPQLQPLA